MIIPRDAVIAIAVILAGLAWFFRYQTLGEGGGTPPAAVVVNRITGELYFIAPDGWGALKERRKK